MNASALSMSVVLALLIPTAAAASTVPSNLAGEWYAGTVYPRSTYTPGSDGFRQAATTARRLNLRTDGTYELTRLERSATVGYFGARMISCEQISVYWEAGTFTVAGGTLTFKPSTSRGINGATPNGVNSGCIRFNGLPYTGKNLKPQPYLWKGSSKALTLSARDAAQEYRRATAAELAHANTPAPAVPAPSPAPAAQPSRPPVPARVGAAGHWTGRFITQGGAPLDVLLTLDDARNGIAGMVYSPDERYIGTAHGNTGAGQLTITLNLPDDTTAELRAEGRFDGDRYTGRFQAFVEEQPMGTGTVTLERR